MEEHGDEQNDEKRGQGRAEGRTERAPYLAELVADEDADVDGEDTRTALREGDEVEKLLFPKPLALLHHLRLDDWDHRIATPEGKGANLEECLETLPVKFHTLLLDV